MHDGTMAPARPGRRDHRLQLPGRRLGWNAMAGTGPGGDTVIWKPSEKTPLTAIACHRIVQEVIAKMPDVPVRW